MLRFITLMLTANILALAAFGAPKRVALVFDDGPRAADAEPLLALLVVEKVSVTFALVGRRVAEAPELAREIIMQGHEIVNHSWAHAHPRDLSDAALHREVADAQKLIGEAVGKNPRWYWPPFLETDPRLDAAVTQAGLKIYMPRHLVSSQDWDTAVSAAEIFRRATTDIQDGTVILFHEWRKETREQLPAMLAELRRQGCAFFTFTALHEALSHENPPR